MSLPVNANIAAVLFVIAGGCWVIEAVGALVSMVQLKEVGAPTLPA